MAKRRKVTRKRKSNSHETVIRVGILGRAAQDFIVTKETKASELAEQLDVNARVIKASKNGTSNFREITADHVVNGYKAILVIPEVSGGK